MLDQHLDQPVVVLVRPGVGMDASLRMLDEADELLAVWDGQPARGYGGTADVVTAARDRGIPVSVIWPAGATRD